MASGQFSNLSFLVFSLVLIMIFMIVSINYVNDIGTKTDFDKRYLALDTGTLLDIMYSSPNNLELTYDMGNIYLYSIDEERSLITIKSRNIEVGKNYHFIRNRNIDLELKDLVTNRLRYQKNESLIKVTER